VNLLDPYESAEQMFLKVNDLSKIRASHILVEKQSQALKVFEELKAAQTSRSWPENTALALQGRGEVTSACSTEARW
jgi:hypothetical protein